MPLPGIPGSALLGLAASDQFGLDVALAGDGDGFSDLVVGSSLYTIGGIHSGRVGVYVGARARA